MTDTAPDYRPIILLPVPTPTDFKPRGGGNALTEKPSRRRQGERLDARFDEIERLLAGASDASLGLVEFSVFGFETGGVSGDDRRPARDPMITGVAETLP